jgi:hypothetical protein
LCIRVHCGTAGRTELAVLLIANLTKPGDQLNAYTTLIKERGYAVIIAKAG